MTLLTTLADRLNGRYRYDRNYHRWEALAGDDWHYTGRNGPEHSLRREIADAGVLPGDIKDTMWALEPLLLYDSAVDGGRAAVDPYDSPRKPPRRPVP